MTLARLPKEQTTSHHRADGRRERTHSSRAKIVAAMMELVGKGDVAPSAVRVAEVAHVGLRSVFRHFDDMDALYREMGQVLEAQVMPIVGKPVVGDTWQAKLLDIAGRRAKVFEILLPFRISANLKRFQSPYLMADYRRMLAAEIEIIDRLLPSSVRADAIGARGLSVILSFQTWRLLRHDQELDVSTAQAVVRRLLSDALARFPAA
jgi:AcrR family transcriptional regulator